MLLALSIANAETMAVLPLERAGASEEYAGLGKGLAGMMVSDLDGIEAIELVERTRLDALLAEIELSESGFVDLETAQELGQGLGAEWVLLGSYSVVAGTFAMDARIVEVESAGILWTASSTGPVADWVAVEKDVVAVLLAEVELSASERRKLMVDTPTESFDALTAWSEGLELEAEGKVDAARAAYAKALKIDPDFVEAQADLSELRAIVGGTLDARAQARIDAADANTRLVLDSISADTEDGFERLVRNGALADAGLHCERAQEMRSWLDEVRWELPTDSRAMGPAHYAMLTRQELTGEQYAAVGAPNYWHAREWLVSPGWSYYGDEVGWELSHAIVACGEDVVVELEALRRDTRELTDEAARHDRSGLTIDDRLALLIAFSMAEEGASAGLTDHIEELLARHPEGSAAAQVVEAQVESILRVVEGTEKDETARLGKSREELMAVERAILEGDSSIFKTPNAACTYLSSHEKSRAASWFARYESARKEYGQDTADSYVQELGMVYGPARDMGCLDEPARVKDPYEAAAFLKEAAQVNQRPDEAYCASKIIEAQNWVVDDNLVENAGDAYVGFATWAPLMTYYNLVQWGCVEPVE